MYPTCFPTFIGHQIISWTLLIPMIADYFIFGYWVGTKWGQCFQSVVQFSVFRYFEVSVCTIKYIVLCYCKYVQCYLFVF